MHKFSDWLASIGGMFYLASVITSVSLVSCEIPAWMIKVHFACSAIALSMFVIYKIVERKNR